MATDTQGKVTSIIGGAAVFVSLLYLGIETRVNTNAIQSAAYHSATMSFADMNLTVARDPALSELWRKSMVSNEADAFDDRERFRFQFLANQLFWRYQDFFDQYRHGTVDDDLWIRRRDFAHILVQIPEWRRWWQTASDGNLFPPSFVDEINSAPDGQSSLIEDLTGNQQTQP